MPGYAGDGQATLLRSNQQKKFWDNEPVVAGQTSIALQLERISHSAYPWGFSVEASFSGDPGVFEIDVMGANDDKLANYQKLGTISAATSLVSGKFVGRYDMATNLWPKFVALYMNTFPNSVNTTAQGTR